MDGCESCVGGARHLGVRAASSLRSRHSRLPFRGGSPAVLASFNRGLRYLCQLPQADPTDRGPIMALPKPAGPRWIRATERRQEVTCVSQVAHWVSHWDVDQGRSRCCGGPQCYLCHWGAPKVLRFVCLVIDERGDEHLLELRERHRPELERAERDFGGLAGCSLVIRKEGPQRNAAVSVKILDHRAVMVRAIEKLVSCLGLPPRMYGGGPDGEGQPQP